MKKEEYAEYLNHPLWQQKRAEVFRRYGKKCGKCGSVKLLTVHHKTYAAGKMPWEYPLENFEVLCEKCHKGAHSLEYTPKNCRLCGKEISQNFQLCFGCHNREVETLRDELSNRTERLKEVERNLQEAVKANRASNQPEVARLDLEYRRLTEEKLEVENKLEKLEKARQEDSQRIQSQLSSLQNMLEALDSKLRMEKSSGLSPDQLSVKRLEEERKHALDEKERLERILGELEQTRKVDTHKIQSQILSLKMMIIGLVILIICGGFILTFVFRSKQGSTQPQNLEFSQSIPTNSEPPPSSSLSKPPKSNVIKPDLEPGKNIPKKSEPPRASPPPQPAKSSINKPDLEPGKNILTKSEPPLASPPPQPAKSNVSSFEDVRQFINKNIILEEVISEVRYAKNGNVYLNVGGRYPKQKLALLVFKDKIGEFGDLKRFENKKVRIIGKVTEYKGEPQIVLHNIKQIDPL